MSKITPYLFGVTAATVTILTAGVFSVIISPATKKSNLPVPSTPEQAAAVANVIMQSKCAACHGVYPQFNGLSNLLSLGQVKRDIEGAQRAFVMAPNGDIRHSDVDFRKMDQVLRTRSMPPALYTAVHLGSGLTMDDVTLLRHHFSEDAAIRRTFSPIRPIHMTDAEFVAQAWGIPVDEAARTPEVMQKAWAKVYLGRRLFHDTRLSTTNQVSCASCHDLTLGGTDNLPKSEGVPGPDGKPQLGGVNAPTVYNAAGNIRQFWDGRAANLQEQAGGPPLNPVEMGYSKPEDWNEIATKLKDDPEYRILFPLVYGEAGITSETITDAIAAFERTLVTPDSDFDRYLTGDATAMTEQQIDGMHTFLNYGCATCHGGPTLGGQSFEYINTHADLRAHAEGYTEGAHGLQDFTRKEEHRDMFRVPNLRNIALTAPYFHTGTVSKLEDAVRIMFDTQTRTTASESQVENVTAFLRAQTGRYYGKPLNELEQADIQPNFDAAQLPGNSEQTSEQE